MSRTLQSPSAPSNNEHLRRASDERWRRPVDRYSVPGGYSQSPWQDGVLWSRSRQMGCAGSSDTPLGQGTCGGSRYGVDDIEVCGVASWFLYRGITQDGSSVPIANAVVTSLRTSDDAPAGPDVVSDTAGGFVAVSLYPTVGHTLIAYKSGSPDVAGVSKNNVVFTAGGV